MLPFWPEHGLQVHISSHWTTEALKYNILRPLQPSKLRYTLLSYAEL
jgi:hypothetical protein